MILKLKPYFEQKPWAGKKLNEIYDCPEGTGEAWIVSGYNGKSSKVFNGKYKGQTLRHLWRKHPELFGDFDDKEFPILIKLISSSQDLSVQVHPNDNYALAKHNSLGKFECWYILDGNEANSVIAGIDANNQREVREFIENNILEEKLIRRNVEKDDLVIIEPGTVHAIQANTFVLEVQESSDITYRLYDYNREPRRELHIEDSLNVLKFNDKKNPVFKFKSNDTFNNKYFDISKFQIQKTVNLHITTYQIVYVLDGICVLNGETLIKGDSVLICKDEEDLNFTGEASLLWINPKKKEDRLKMRKVALITGIASQDGSYLTEFLIDKGYEVHGLINTRSLLQKDCLKTLVENEEIMNKTLFFHLGDMTDSSGLNRVIENIKPDEIYHLASQSHVDVSFEMPEYTADVNAMGTLRLVDAIKQSDLRTKLFNASTCQLFEGKKVNAPQNEETPFNPQSPYATSKLYAHYIVNNYRDAYGIYAVNGILFNHSSSREEESFVGKKITTAVKKIVAGHQKVLKIGNLYATRDWGYAPDYVEGMWLSLQQEMPDDYVFATGETHTIKEFIEIAFKCVNINIKWQGEGLDEKGINQANGDVLVEIDSKFYRVNEAKYLCGDSTKAKKQLGWSHKHSFNDLVNIMVGEL